MNAKTVALIVTFSGLAMVLNPAISGIALPFPPMPTLYFQVWEIPLIIAFILFGFRVALIADLINAVFLFALFPGPSQPYYVTSALATFGTMLGIFAASRLLTFNTLEIKPAAKAKFLSASVFLAILFRTVVMASVMFCILYFDPLGVFPPIPATFILVSILPLQAVFNVIVPLYLVPTSYLISKLVNRNLKTESKIV